MRVCAVIPAYNESAAIGGVITKLRKLGLDVVVVDDGSKDGTAAKAQASGAQVVVNRVNMGKGASLVRGMEFAAAKPYEYFLAMDGDGQHEPEAASDFIAKAASTGCGLVIGNRMERPQGMPLVRLLTNRFMSWLISLLAGQRVPDTQCGYRLISRELAQKMKLKTTQFEIESEMILQASRLGYCINSVPIKAVYADEVSRINPFLDTLRFIRFIARDLCTRGGKK